MRLPYKIAILALCALLPLTMAPTGGIATRFAGATAFAGATTVCATGSLCAIAYNNETFDTSNLHDNVTNNSRINIPTATSYFQCSANGVISGNTTATTNTDVHLYIRANGTDYRAETGYYWQNQTASSMSSIGMSVTTPVIQITLGGYMEAVVLSNGFTGNVTMNAHTGSSAQIAMFSCWNV